MARLQLTKVFSVVVMAFSFFHSHDADAATIKSRMTESDGQAVIELSGRIQEGDYGKVGREVRYWNDRGIRVSGLRLNSAGGQILEAINIAKAIRSAEIAAVVGRNRDCLSACALIFAYATEKWADSSSRIGVHCASLDGKQTVESDALTAMLVRDLKTVGTPDSVISKTIVTPPDEIALLSLTEIQAMGGKIVGLQRAKL